MCGMSSVARVCLLVFVTLPGAGATDNQMDCIANTGAFCILNCGASRGDGYCKWGRCFCNEGSCAGSDEICHEGAASAMTDSTDGQVYHITNSRWPEFKLYATGHGPLTSSKRGHSDSGFQWTFKHPPRLDASVPPAFLVESQKYRDAVMVIDEWVSCTTREYSDGGDLTDWENTVLAMNNDSSKNLTLPEGWEWDEAEPRTADEVDDPENVIELDLNETTNESEGGERRLASRRRFVGPRRRFDSRRRFDYRRRYSGGSSYDRRRYGHSYTECRDVRSPQTRWVQGSMWGLGPNPPIFDIQLRFEKAPLVHRQQGQQLVMISNMQNSYLYIPQFGVYGFGGWGTRALEGDPGAGGYWYFEPPLPDELWDQLEVYTGRTCSFNCGVPSDRPVYVGSALGSRLNAVAMLLSVSVVVVALGPYI